MVRHRSKNPLWRVLPRIGGQLDGATLQRSAPRNVSVVRRRRDLEVSWADHAPQRNSEIGAALGPCICAAAWVGVGFVLAQALFDKLAIATSFVRRSATVAAPAVWIGELAPAVALTITHQAGRAVVDCPSTLVAPAGCSVPRLVFAHALTAIVAVWIGELAAAVTDAIVLPRCFAKTRRAAPVEETAILVCRHVAMRCLARAFHADGVRATPNVARFPLANWRAHTLACAIASIVGRAFVVVVAALAGRHVASGRAVS